MSAPAVTPRLALRAPQQPVAHRYGLFAVATMLEDAEPHALAGVEYEAVCSTRVDTYPAPCEPTVPAELEVEPKVGYPTTQITVGTPFGVWAADSCVLGRDQGTARAQLRTRFTLGEETAVEALVASGELGNVPNLAGADVITTTAAPDLIDAVGVLEQWLADTTGGVGVIHLPLWAAPRVAAQLVATFSGPRATTVLGSSVAFGAGYEGIAPTAGADDGTLWLYATPPITVRRSRLVEPADWSTGGFERDTNTGLLLTERIYVVDWPCMAVAAVKTSLTRAPA